MLVTVAATLFACGVAVRLRTTKAAPLMQVPIFVATFLAPVYTPRRLMTGWVRTVADVNPVSTLLETGRALLAGRSGAVGTTLAALLITTAVLAVWALYGLTKAKIETA